MIRKRAQEEIVGFVMIVLIVSVIAVILLGITLMHPKKGIEKESKEASQFLDSMLDYTTDCAISYIPAYKDLEGLIKECYNNPNKKCVSGENVCVAMNQTIKQIIDNSWNIGENSPYKGYVFEADYEENKIILIKKGICGFESIGAKNIGGSQSPTISFKLCF